MDPFSGVHQIKLQLGVHSPIDAIIGGAELLRAVNNRGRLACWALKGVEVVRVAELETDCAEVFNSASSKLPSGHMHIGSGSYEVLRRGQKGQ